VAAAAAIDWERVDHTAVEVQRQQFQDRWRGAPFAGFRDERALRKRFEKTLGEVAQRLAAARTAEIGRREQLIATVEALREAPDLRGAISEARTLQQRWRDEAGPLRLTRFEEQKLWQRFRKACDAVFARRDAERAEQVAQREKRAHTRAALLDGLAAALSATDAAQIKRALAQFRTDWDASRTGRGEATDALDQRARALQQQAQRRIDEVQRQAYRERLEQMAQRAAPADGVDAEALAAGRKEREELLIDLEIALDLPTPEAFAAARRRRQLERLQVRFRGDHLQPPRAEDLLARLYAAPAQADVDMDARVAAVVRRLVEQGAAATK
jgi:exonuclease SbcC